MSEIVQFSSPPVVEALLDIRVNLPAETSLDRLAAFHDKIKKEYPVKNTKMQYETSLQMKEGQDPVTNFAGGPIGYIFKSSDGKKIVQARLDGFTLNILKPYSDWETFHAEAKMLWLHYLEIAHPIGLTRIALRYINLIEIPLPFTSFGEYVKIVPELPEGIPQALSDLFIRLVVPDPSSENIAIITETIDRSKTNDKSLGFLLDIDVFRTVNLAADEDMLWDIFKSLREYKNTIFAKSITEKTIDLLEG